MDDIQTLGGTVLSELAKTFENRPTALLPFFPARDVQEKTVRIERIFQGVGMAPIVRAGQPDVFAGNRQVESEEKSPIYGRESKPIPQDIINNLRMPGTVNEKYGRKYVADEIKYLTGRNDSLFDFIRSQALLGGVDYTDPRTNERIVIDSGIPTDHKVENKIDWSNPEADIVDEIEQWKELVKNNGLATPTHLIMNGVRRGILSRHKSVRALAETARDPGKVRFLNGELTHIAGLEIVEENKVYEHLTQNNGVIVPTVQKMVPDDKIVIVSKENEGEPFGRTDFVIGENPDGMAGIWSRASETLPPAAPGVLLQVGRAGLAYVRYPKWVVVATIVPMEQPADPANG